MDVDDDDDDDVDDADTDISDTSEPVSDFGAGGNFFLVTFFGCSTFFRGLFFGGSCSIPSPSKSNCLARVHGTYGVPSKSDW